MAKTIEKKKTSQILPYLVVLEEIFKNRGAGIALGFDPMKITDEEKKCLSDYFSLISFQFDRIIENNRIERINKDNIALRRDNELSSEEAFGESRENIENKVAHQDGDNADDYGHFFNVEVLELARQLRVVSQVLKKNADQMNLKDIDALMFYIPNILRESNLVQIASLFSMHLSKTKANSDFIQYVVKGRHSQSEHTDRTNEEVFNLSKKLIVNLQKSVGDSPYLNLRHMIAFTAGVDSLLELDRINKITNQKTNETSEDLPFFKFVDNEGGLNSTRGMRVLYEIMSSHEFERDIDPSYVVQLRNIMAKRFDKKEDGSFVIKDKYRSGSVERLKTARDNLYAVLFEQKDEGENSIVLDSYRRAMISSKLRNSDIFTDISRREEIIDANLSGISDLELKQNLKKKFDEMYLIIYSKAASGNGKYDRHTFTEAFKQFISKYELPDSVNADSLCASLSENVYLEILAAKNTGLLSKKNGDLLFDYLESYQLLAELRSRLYKDAEFLCAQSLGKKGEEYSLFPGRSHSLLSENVTRGSLSLNAGTSLLQLGTYYNMLLAYKEKLKSLMLEGLDETWKSEIEERLGKLDMEISSCRADIDSYINLDEKVIEDNLRENLIKGAYSLDSMYLKDEFKKQSVNALKNGIVALSNEGQSKSVIEKMNGMLSANEFMQTSTAFKKWLCFSMISGFGEQLYESDLPSRYLSIIEQTNAWPKDEIRQVRSLYEEIKKHSPADIKAETVKLVQGMLDEEGTHTVLNFFDIHDMVEGIPACEKAIKKIQMQSHKKYENDYMNAFRSFKKTIGILDYEYKNGKTLPQMMGEFAKAINENQLETTVSLVASRMEEEYKDRCSQMLRPIIAKTICRDGFTLSTADYYQKQVNYSVNKYSIELLAQKLKKHDTSEILKGTKSISYSGSVYIVNHDHILDNMKEYSAYQLAENTFYLYDNGIIEDRNQAIKTTGDQIKSLYGSEIQHINERIDEINSIESPQTDYAVKQYDAVSSLIARDRAYNMRGTAGGSSYPWKDRQDAVESLIKDFPLSDFSELYSSVLDKDFERYSRLLTQNKFASPIVKQTLQAHPARENGNTERYIEISQDFAVQSIQELAIEKQKLEEKKNMCRHYLDNAELYARTFFASADIFSVDKKLSRESIYRDEILKLQKELSNISPMLNFDTSVSDWAQSISQSILSTSEKAEIAAKKVHEQFIKEDYKVQSNLMLEQLMKKLDDFVINNNLEEIKAKPIPYCVRKQCVEFDRNSVTNNTMRSAALELSAQVNKKNYGQTEEMHLSVNAEESEETVNKDINAKDIFDGPDVVTYNGPSLLRKYESWEFKNLKSYSGKGDGMFNRLISDQDAKTKTTSLFKNRGKKNESGISVEMIEKIIFDQGTLTR